MRAFDNLYEEPAFEAPSPKEQSVVYAALGLGTVAVAAIQLQLQLTVRPSSCLPRMSVLPLSFLVLPSPSVARLLDCGS